MLFWTQILWEKILRWPALKSLIFFFWSLLMILILNFLTGRKCYRNKILFKDHPFNRINVCEGSGYARMLSLSAVPSPEWADLYSDFSNKRWTHLALPKLSGLKVRSARIGVLRLSEARHLQGRHVICEWYEGPRKRDVRDIHEHSSMNHS